MTSYDELAPNLKIKIKTHDLIFFLLFFYKTLWHCLCHLASPTWERSEGRESEREREEGEGRTNSWRKEMQKCEQSKTKKKLFSLKRTFKWKCSAWLNTNNKCRQTNCIYLVNNKKKEKEKRRSGKKKKKWRTEN